MNVLFFMGKKSWVETSAFLLLSLAIIAINRNVRTHGFQNFINKEAIFYLVVPIAIIFLSKHNLKDFGLAIGDRKKARKYMAILFLAAIPFMLIGASMREFQIYYPRFGYSNAFDFILWEAMVGLLMLSTEFFYRGFMLFGLDRLGKGAILVQAIPYAYVHLGKPMLEVYYSFFAGIVFGYIDWESKSILPSFLLHWTTSIIFDSLCILLS